MIDSVSNLAVMGVVALLVAMKAFFASHKFVWQCHSQTTVSDRVRGSQGLGISGKITKMDFEEGSFPKGNLVT